MDRRLQRIIDELDARQTTWTLDDVWAAIQDLARRQGNNDFERQAIDRELRQLAAGKALSVAAGAYTCTIPTDARLVRQVMEVRRDWVWSTQELQDLIGRDERATRRALVTLRELGVVEEGVHRGEWALVAVPAAAAEPVTCGPVTEPADRLPHGWVRDGDWIVSERTPDHVTYRRGLDLSTNELWISAEDDSGSTRLVTRPLRDGETVDEALEWLERETPRVPPTATAAVIEASPATAGVAEPSPADRPMSETSRIMHATDVPERILALLAQRGPMNSVEIAEELQLSTAGRMVVHRMERAGLLRRVGSIDLRKGLPVVIWQVNQAGPDLLPGTATDVGASVEPQAAGCNAAPAPESPRDSTPPPSSAVQGSSDDGGMAWLAWRTLARIGHMLDGEPAEAVDVAVEKLRGDPRELTALVTRAAVVRLRDQQWSAAVQQLMRILGPGELDTGPQSSVLLSLVAQAEQTIRELREKVTGTSERVRTLERQLAELRASAGRSQSLQPAPQGGTGDVWAAILAEVPDEFVDCHDVALTERYLGRRMLGLGKYGQPLRLDDGRDPVLDVEEEALDLTAYSVRLAALRLREGKTEAARRLVWRAATASSWASQASPEQLQPPLMRAACRLAGVEPFELVEESERPASRVITEEELDALAAEARVQLGGLRVRVDDDAVVVEMPAGTTSDDDCAVIASASSALADGFAGEGRGRWVVGRRTYTDEQVLAALVTEALDALEHERHRRRIVIAAIEAVRGQVTSRRRAPRWPPVAGAAGVP